MKTFRLARRSYQKAAAFVETILAVPIVLFFGLSTVQYGLLLHAKANLNYAAYEAARAGATDHGKPETMKLALSRALTPLYGGGKTQLELTASYARAQASLASAVLQVVSPSRESFDDFGKYDAKVGARVIRNDNLQVVSNAVKGNSGQSIQDANLLKIRIVFAYKPEVPLAGRILSLYTQQFGMTGEDPIADGMRAQGLIPVVVQATLRMQSDPWENSLLVSNPGRGNDGQAPTQAPQDQNPPQTGQSAPGESGGSDSGSGSTDGDDDSSASDVTQDDGATPLCTQQDDCSGSCVALDNGGGSGGGGAVNDALNNAPNEGMMGAAAHSLLAGLALSDTPLVYRPAKGPAVPLTIAYSQREAYQPERFHYSNLGPKWTYAGIGYVVDDPARPGHNVQRYMAGGGTRKFKDKDYNTGTGAFAPDPRDMSVLAKVSDKPLRYERRLNDGSVDIYAHSDGKTAFPRRIFLTEQRDSAGNALKYHYDAQNRLTHIVDASGRKTTLEYAHADPLKITALVDPAGRRARIAYDAQGRLASITDAVGMVSKLAYRGASAFVERLETPYGTTRFATGEDAHSRWLEATDPLGRTRRVESRWGAAPIAASEKEVPSGLVRRNRKLNRYNTFYWDAEAYAKHKGDYAKAHTTHWLIEDGQMVDLASSIKAPLDSRVWYAYQGQKNGVSPGSCNRPATMARVLPGCASQIEQIDYNPQGRPTYHLDPLRRETRYEYAPNGIDLLKIRQKNGERYDTLAQMTWNDRHRPLSVTDAAGQTTRYAWNEAGQPTGISNALGGKKEYRYDELGRLAQIIDAQGRAQTRYTYDEAGNLASETDSEGRTLKHRYDALSRETKTLYPDGTSIETVWGKLDIVQIKARSGQSKRFEYDAVRNRISEQDALRTLRFGYDAMGRLVRLTDGNGKLTQWVHDLQGRVIAKTTADGAKTRYEYDSAGRRIKRTDALGQEQRLNYATDDRLTAIAWTNARHPTPEVRIRWDDAYPRIAEIADGLGLTRYRYGPAGAPGALRLTEETGMNGALGQFGETGPAPRARTARRITWDAAGRLKGWRLSHAGEEAGEDYAYDALGRIANNRNNALGRFDYSYLGETEQIAKAALAGTPIQRAYAYESNAGDRRLKTIRNPENARSYAYVNAPGLIIKSLTETGQGQSKTWQYEYDAIERLQSAQRSDGQTYRYRLDAADNLTALATPAGTKTYRHDAGNKIEGYQYDANGSRIEDERHTYQWDAENRLIKIEPPRESRRQFG
ncbi:MAG: pilus assembly protein [Betaproteobacteria bacterium]|nr:pilus assembly protein [Betaproteobacteria bacterium]